MGCAEHTCGNPRLLEYVINEGTRVGVPVPALEQFQSAMEETIGTDIESAARAMEAFVARNESGTRVTERLEGLRMNEYRSEAPSQTVPLTTDATRASDAIWVGLPVVVFLLTWSIRRRRR